MSYFKAKIHQIRFRLGLRPRPRWGSLQRSPRLEVCGNNFWHTIPSHSHDFIPTPIPGDRNSETLFPFPFAQKFTYSNNNAEIKLYTVCQILQENAF